MGWALVNSWIDWRTLGTLFCLLACVAALREAGAFEALASRALAAFGRGRGLIGAIVGLTGLLSLLATNDVALVVMLPLALACLRAANCARPPLVATVFVLQALAANLLGMLTPFGNPQNLFLYTYFEIGTLEFLQIMVRPVLISAALLAACCLVLVPRVEAQPATKPQVSALKVKEWAPPAALFALSLLAVLRVMDWKLALVIVTAGLAATNRAALRRVDFKLLATFLAIFIFTGALAESAAARALLTSTLDGHEMLAAAALSQVISNVPAATLLAGFTTNYAPLLLGVNIGGAGTPIASLASLIALNHYAEFARNEQAALAPFLTRFLALNFCFLAVLLIAC